MKLSTGCLVAENEVRVPQHSPCVALSDPRAVSVTPEAHLTLHLSAPGCFAPVTRSCPLGSALTHHPVGSCPGAHQLVRGILHCVLQRPGKEPPTVGALLSPTCSLCYLQGLRYWAKQPGECLEALKSKTVATGRVWTCGECRVKRTGKTCPGLHWLKLKGSRGLDTEVITGHGRERVQGRGDP